MATNHAVLSGIVKELRAIAKGKEPLSARILERRYPKLYKKIMYRFGNCTNAFIFAGLDPEDSREISESCHPEDLIGQLIMHESICINYRLYGIKKSELPLTLQRSCDKHYGSYERAREIAGLPLKTSRPQLNKETCLLIGCMGMYKLPFKYKILYSRHSEISEKNKIGSSYTTRWFLRDIAGYWSKWSDYIEEVSKEIQKDGYPMPIIREKAERDFLYLIVNAYIDKTREMYKEISFFNTNYRS